jgi:hypothetical protein
MHLNLPQSGARFERAGDDERVDDERATVAKPYSRNPIVNPVRWAKQNVTEQACQNEADTKAFKGRGKLLELRQLLAELDRTLDAMKNLIEVTKQVQDAQMYLMMHVKNSSGLTFLRWRERLGACRHVPWPEAHERIAEFVPDVRDWYREATDQALALNERHKDLRRAIATARRVVMRRAPLVYARPVLTPDRSQKRTR